MKKQFSIAAVFLGLAWAWGAPISAANIIDEWSEVKAPPAPALREAKVDPKTTALLSLDFMSQTCNKERRPRCYDSLPSAKTLLTKARANGLFIVHGVVTNGTAAEIVSDVAPVSGEPYFVGGHDKFFNSDLEKTLRDHGVTTVIVTGTSANGAVLYTASGAAFRGFNVIVPVDAMSSDDRYLEQFTAWQLAKDTTFSQRVTLTKSDMIGF